MVGAAQLCICASFRLRLCFVDDVKVSHAFGELDDLFKIGPVPAGSGHPSTPEGKCLYIGRCGHVKVF